jgi:hypothetical protein
VKILKYEVGLAAYPPPHGLCVRKHRCHFTGEYWWHRRIFLRNVRGIQNCGDDKKNYRRQVNVSSDSDDE